MLATTRLSLALFAGLGVGVIAVLATTRALERSTARSTIWAGPD